jgi:hypothetical protein
MKNAVNLCLAAIVTWAALCVPFAMGADVLTDSGIVGWNRSSKQFIDPPLFRLLPRREASDYRATLRQHAKTWTIRSKTPSIDLAPIWPELDTKPFSLDLQWLDAAGNTIAKESSRRVKAPDFAGFNEPAADWAAAADRNVAYLIHTADHGVVADLEPGPPDYIRDIRSKHPEYLGVAYREPGVPVWIWTASPYCPHGYPNITVPTMIHAFLAHAENNGRQKDDALRLARVAADWALEHRWPQAGSLPLFPYSTISGGKLEGGVEGDSINLLRGSWLAIGFVDLYAKTRHEPYLSYARHIADVTVKFQNADGSFPYRVNQRTGAVVEQYNCSAMEFVELVEKLEPFGHDARRALAAERALEWVLAYACTTHNWKAAYEDVGDQPAFTNLSQMPVMPLIRYLCRHKDENPAYLPMAIRLNRWVEDQFVVFGPENEASPVRVKGPLVFEQFVCWWPMEGHTGNWILALIELHKATRHKTYLDKARAAANAICAGQYPDGQFSTFGRDHQTGIAPEYANRSGGGNWYNANAMAGWALYALASYSTSLKAMDGTESKEPLFSKTHKRVKENASQTGRPQ